MTRAILFSGLCLCLASSLASCDASDDDAVLSIGVVLPLTGTLSDAGTSTLEGMELALDEINDSDYLGGTQLAFVTEDNLSTVEDAKADVNFLISEFGVPVILGPFSSTATEDALSLIDDESGVVLFSPTSAAAGLSAQSKWLFRSTLTVDRIVPPGVEISKNYLDFERVATIVNGADAFSVSNNDKVADVVLEDPELTIVDAQFYTRPLGTPIGDLTSELTEMGAADPDVIFLSGLPEDRVGVITQAHALDIDNLNEATFVSTLFAITDLQTIQDTAPGAAEGVITLQVWLEASDEDLSKAFVTNYLARHGETPGAYSARGYAAAYILAEAIANAVNHEAESIRESLVAIDSLDTIFGKFSFDENGDAVYDPVVAEVQDSTFVPIN